VEITGGRFWAPYKSEGDAKAAPPAANQAMPGLDPSLFRNRTPLDLSNPRLRKLTAALAPLYVRVSGSWANSVYFHDSGDPTPATPPTGFSAVLTRSQWRGLIDFTRAVNAHIVTSFAISAGVRDSDGVWTPKEARKITAFTKAAGSRIAAAEMFNEPTFAAIAGGAPGYDAKMYGRDFAVFRAFAKQEAPDMIILGPGSIGEAAPLVVGGGITPPKMLKSEDLLAASGRGVDVFSYHFYPSVSKRCMPAGAPPITPEKALSDERMMLTLRDLAFYAALRDRFEPGKPMWLTETGEAACGGDTLGSTFADSFRYLNQLGVLAKRGVQVVMQNTLNASDYGVIDEETLTPRPNYWSALLWNKLMGTTVLDAGASAPGVYVYAHCLRDHPGGVAVLAINADRGASHDLTTDGRTSRFTLTAKDLLATTVALNGRELQMGAGDALPEITGQDTAPGKVALAPASITFLVFPKAGNSSCR
jgi:heparanase 1